MPQSDQLSFAERKCKSHDFAVLIKQDRCLLLHSAAYRQRLWAVMTPSCHSRVLLQRIIRSRPGPAQVRLLYWSCSPAGSSYNCKLACSWQLYGWGALQATLQALKAFPPLLKAAILVSLVTSVWGRCVLPFINQSWCLSAQKVEYLLAAAGQNHI